MRCLPVLRAVGIALWLAWWLALVAVLMISILVVTALQPSPGHCAALRAHGVQGWLWVVPLRTHETALITLMSYGGEYVSKSRMEYAVSLAAE
jgi:hypothetical protein